MIAEADRNAGAESLCNFLTLYWDKSLSNCSDDLLGSIPYNILLIIRLMGSCTNDVSENYVQGINLSASGWVAPPKCDRKYQCTNR